MKTIMIIAALNGWIIEVGCQKVVFNDLEKMLTAMRAYYTNPKAEEEAWLTDSINAKWTVAPEPAPRTVVPDLPGEGIRLQEAGEVNINMERG